MSNNNLKPNIKVIGVGGGGGNAISYMSTTEINGVEFLAANTDAQDLESLENINKKIQLGEKLTEGLGAGANPTIGRKAAEENSELISNYLEGTHLLFISAGMGGGTGTGAAPVIAEIAKEMGILVIAIVTKPFSFERNRMEKAEKGIEELREYVDSLIVIPNESLKDNFDDSMPIIKIFERVDSVLHDSVQGISDIITKPGLINIDFNDLKTVMKDSGNAMIGIGKATGENRAREAAINAINCPFLENKLSQAKRVIVNINLEATGSLHDFNEVGKVIESITDKNAEVIIGTTINEENNDELTVTIIATDFTAKVEEKPTEENPFDEEDSREKILSLLDIPKNKQIKKNINIDKIETTKKEESLIKEEKEELEAKNKKIKNIKLPSFLKQRQ